MLIQDYTAKLLNLEDVNITNAESISGELHIHIELPRKEHTCPVCGAVTDRVHDYQMQTIKDIPLARNTFLHLRKRRYRCNCGKRFFGRVPVHGKGDSPVNTPILRGLNTCRSPNEEQRKLSVGGDYC